MKLKRVCFRAHLVVFLAVTVQTGFAQDEIVVVPQDATWDYLYTTVHDGIDFRAANPHSDPAWEFVSPNPLESVALWTLPSYRDAGTGNLPTVHATIWQEQWIQSIPGDDTSWFLIPPRDNPGPAFDLEWNSGTGPFYYGSINFYNNNGGVPASATQLHDAAVARGDVPANDGDNDLDGAKITYYFRTDFTSTEDFDTLLLDYLVDDAAVAYIDGKEVLRVNCCSSGEGGTFMGDGSGTLEQENLPYFNAASLDNTDWTEAPAGTENGPRGTTFVDLSPFGGTLPAGNHTLSFSIHNYTGGGANGYDIDGPDGPFNGSVPWRSSDLVGDFRLFATTAENQWGLASGGRWNDTANWSLLVPNGVGATANLWSNTAQNSTIIHNGADIVLGTLSFDHTNRYVIAGLGGITFDSGGGNSLIEVLQGNHEFQLVVSLNNDVDVDVASGATLAFNNTVHLNGNSLNAVGQGTLLLNNAVTNNAPLAIAAGAIGGTGSVLGDVVNTGGNLTPGNALGTFTVEGDFRQELDGRLTLEIGGTAPNQYDVLAVGGTATLGGTLAVELIEGYVPRLGDTYQLIAADTFAGAFNQFVLPDAVLAAHGLSFDISQLSLSGTLSVVPEPASGLLAASLLLLLGCLHRRRG